MIQFDDKIIDKWSPYVRNHLNIKNIYFEYICCYYLETLNTEDIPIKIIELKKVILELKEFKKEIKGEYFNILTGRTEYLLEGGKIVDVENFLEIIDNNDIVKIFGIEFLHKIDKSSGRDFKINNILDENRK